MSALQPSPDDEPQKNVLVGLTKLVILAFVSCAIAWVLVKALFWLFGLPT